MLCVLFFVPPLLFEVPTFLSDLVRTQFSHIQLRTLRAYSHISLHIGALQRYKDNGAKSEGHTSPILLGLDHGRVQH